MLCPCCPGLESRPFLCIIYLLVAHAMQAKGNVGYHFLGTILKNKRVFH